MVYRYLDLFGMVFTDPNGLVSGMVYGIGFTTLVDVLYNLQ